MIRMCVYVCTPRGLSDVSQETRVYISSSAVVVAVTPLTCLADRRLCTLARCIVIRVYAHHAASHHDAKAAWSMFGQMQQFHMLEELQ